MVVTSTSTCLKLHQLILAALLLGIDLYYLGIHYHAATNPPTLHPYVTYRTSPGMSSAWVGPQVGCTMTTPSAPTFSASSARVKSYRDNNKAKRKKNKQGSKQT